MRSLKKHPSNCTEVMQRKQLQLAKGVTDPQSTAKLMSIPGFVHCHDTSWNLVCERCPCQIKR